MGKRLIRIFQKDIQANISKLVGMELNLVLINNKTYHGLLESAEKDVCVLKDFLSGKHKIKIQEILEIIYDKEAIY